MTTKLGRLYWQMAAMLAIAPAAYAAPQMAANRDGIAQPRQSHFTLQDPLLKKLQQQHVITQPDRRVILIDAVFLRQQAMAKFPAPSAEGAEDAATSWLRDYFYARLPRNNSPSWFSYHGLAERMANGVMQLTPQVFDVPAQGHHPMLQFVIAYNPFETRSAAALALSQNSGRGLDEAWPVVDVPLARLQSFSAWHELAHGLNLDAKDTIRARQQLAELEDIIRQWPELEITGAEGTEMRPILRLPLPFAGNVRLDGRLLLAAASQNFTMALHRDEVGADLFACLLDLKRHPGDHSLTAFIIEARAAEALLPSDGAIEIYASPRALQAALDFARQHPDQLARMGVADLLQLADRLRDQYALSLAEQQNLLHYQQANPQQQALLAAQHGFIEELIQLDQRFRCRSQAGWQGNGANPNMLRQYAQEWQEALRLAPQQRQDWLEDREARALRFHAMLSDGNKSADLAWNHAHQAVILTPR